MDAIKTRSVSDALELASLADFNPTPHRDVRGDSGVLLTDYANSCFHLSWTWLTGKENEDWPGRYGLYLSWEIHSKSFMLVTFSSISFAATSFAWTSITIRADNTARCILDNFPRTRATKLPSWVRKRKYFEAIHIPKTQAVLTQCNQTYGMLNPDHRLCPCNFCLFSSQIHK